MINNQHSTMIFVGILARIVRAGTFPVFLLLSHTFSAKLKDW